LLGFCFFKTLLLRFRSLALCLSPCFSLSGGLGVALLLCLSGSEPLLLGFLSLAFCFGLGRGFCLALLFCFGGSEPLLFGFRGLALCFGIGCGFGLVRARRIRLYDRGG
jgi:hypothetical protein